MKITIYYTFKEFEENYKDDLKKWFDIYPDATEYDYLNELRDIYRLFLYQNNFDFIINSNWIPDEYPEHYELSMIAYHEFMQEKLLQYMYNNGFSNFDGDHLEIPVDTNVMDFWEDCNVRTRKNSAIIDDEKHKYLKDFFTFDNYMEKLDFDVKKFTNFKYASTRIIDFLSNKIIQVSASNTTELDRLSKEYEVLNNITSIENKLKDTDEKTQNKYSIPQIIKILDKLNIKGMMGEKGFTDFQTVQLLADIFGRSEKSIRNNFDSDTHKNTAETYISELKNLKAKR